MPLYVTFAPSMDGILRTSLPKEIQIALHIYKALFYQGRLVPQPRLVNSTDSIRALLIGVVNPAMPTPGGLGPHCYGTSETGLGRDLECQTPRSRTMDPPIASSNSGWPHIRPPPFAVAVFLSHPGGWHHLLVLVGQCALHWPHQDSLVLPRGYY